MKFTAKSIAALEPPAGKSDHVEWDDSFPGFGLRMRQGGSRMWIFQYALGKKQRRMTLGSASAMTLAKARDIASELHARVRLGQDPAGQKAESQLRAAETFEAIARRYLGVRKGEMRPGAYDEVERHLVKHAKPFHRYHLDGVDQRAIAARILELKETSGAVAANRVRSSLSAMYAWAMRQGLAKQNPVTNTSRFEERSRERTLSDGELAAIWRAAEDDMFGTILKLLMLTGQRLDEIASPRWSEIDLHAGVIVLPGERVKNGRQHQLPLSLPVRTILEGLPRRLNPDGTFRDLVFGIGQGGFAGSARAKTALEQRIAASAGKPIAPWRLHDLRRTFATGLQRLGVRLEVTESILNHVSGSRGGIIGVYQRHDWATEKRIALDAWATHLMRVIEGEGADNIVSLRQPA
jgi:integrase